MKYNQSSQDWLAQIFKDTETSESTSKWSFRSKQHLSAGANVEMKVKGAEIFQRYANTANVTLNCSVVFVKGDTLVWYFRWKHQSISTEAGN